MCVVVLCRIDRVWSSKERVCCALSSLLFNIYVRELGKVISNCVHVVVYAVVGKDGVMEWKQDFYMQMMCV